MGEIAEAYIWGEMMGLDMDSPEDWELYYESSQPPSPDYIADEARMLLDSINMWADEEAPPTTAEILEELFPELHSDQSALIATGLRLLAAQVKEN